MNGEEMTIATFVAVGLILIGPALGIWTSRRQADSQGHAESEMRFGTIVTGLSASASGNSAFILVGAVGLGYTMGVSALWIAVGFWVGDILFWYFIAHRLMKRVQETGVDTISELISHQATTAKVAPLRVGAVVAIMAVGLFCVAQFLAVGKIAVELYQIDKITAMALVVGAGLTTVLLGGLGSSIIVNVYQSALMIAAAAALIVFVLLSVLSGDINADTVEINKSLLDPFFGFTPLSFALFFITFVVQGLLFATCNPNVLARITKGNLEEVPRIRWVYMGFMQSLWWLMTFVGVALAIIVAPVSDPDSAGISFAQSAMPAVILGVFVAGVAAASFSTGEAQLLVIANALTMDLAPVRFQNLSSEAKKRALIGGRALVGLGLFLALISVDFNIIGELVIQSASLLLSAFAVPAILFVYRMPIGGRMTAAAIILGGGAALWTRLTTSMPPGQEIFLGLIASTIVAMIGLLMAKKRKKA